MVVSLIGLNHTTAALGQRERLAITEEDLAKYLPAFMRNENIKEVIILSTCNRTEFLMVSDRDDDVFAYTMNFIHREKGYSHQSKAHEFYFYQDLDAVKHLFKVTAGLDSLVAGETQISNQVKKAYSAAVQYGATGPVLNRLLHSAFRVSKRIRSETGINKGALSVGYAAVELAKQLFPSIEDCKVLLIGAGEIANITAKNLFDQNVKELVIANRTLEHAASLAKELQGRPVEMKDLIHEMSNADIVISATSSKDIIVRYESVLDFMESRGGRCILLLDLSVPRDIDPKVAGIPNAKLVNIDGLKEIVERNSKARQQEYPKAYLIIEEEALNFIRWRCTLRISPIIRNIKDKFEALRQAELEKWKSGNTPETLEILEQFTRGLVDRLLQVPVEKLKEYNLDCESCREYIPLVEAMFDVNEGKNNEKTCCWNPGQFSGNDPVKADRGFVNEINKEI